MRFVILLVLSCGNCFAYIPGDKELAFTCFEKKDLKCLNAIEKSSPNDRVKAISIAYQASYETKYTISFEKLSSALELYPDSPEINEIIRVQNLKFAYNLIEIFIEELKSAGVLRRLGIKHKELKTFRDKLTFGLKQGAVNSFNVIRLSLYGQKYFDDWYRQLEQANQLKEAIVRLIKNPREENVFTSSEFYQQVEINPLAYEHQLPSFQELGIGGGHYDFISPGFFNRLSRELNIFNIYFLYKSSVVFEKMIKSKKFQARMHSLGLSRLAKKLEDSGKKGFWLAYTVAHLADGQEIYIGWRAWVAANANEWDSIRNQRLQELLGQ